MNRYKHLLDYAPYLLFLVAYSFAYLPYYLFYPLPDIQQDSYIYFWIATLIRDGVVPFPKFTIDVPVGHPLYIYAVKALFANTNAVIYVQNILFILSSLYFIHCFGRLNSSMRWIAGVSISLFAIDSFTMRINTSLYTESIYTSALILIGANSALVAAKFNRFHIVLLVFSLLLPGLIRPNGIYVFFIIPLLVCTVWRSKKGIAYQWCIVGSVMVLLLLWSSINFYFKGIFMPSDPYRLEWVKNRALKRQLTDTAYYNKLKQLQPDIAKGVEHKKGVTGKFLHTKGELLKANVYAFADTKPSFYFSFLPARNKMIYEDNMVGDPRQRLFNRFRVDSAAPQVKPYLFEGVTGNSALSKRIKAECNLAAQKSKLSWTYSIHVLYKIYDLLVWNRLWLYAFFVLGAYAGVSFFRSTSLSDFLLVNLFLMHFISLVVITIGHGGFQMRYVHVSTLFVLVFVFSQIFSLFGGLKKPFKT